ncbi:MAG: hypothetical protein AAGJ85_09680, partial [Pseudomonadota bacterium]
MKRTSLHKLLYGAVLGTALVGSAFAQTESIAGDAAETQALLNTYTPADFERFQPNTALDMVFQIPGFSL